MLAMICLAVFLGIAVLGVFVISRLQASLSRQLIEDEKRLLLSVRQGLALKFGEIQQQLFNLAGHSALQKGDSSLQSKAITSLLAQNPLFLNGIVYDREGNVISATSRNPSSSDERFLNRNLLKNTKTLPKIIESFREALEMNRLSVSETVSSVRTGQLLVMNVPIRVWDNPASVTGVLSIGLHLNGAMLQELLQGFFSGEGFLFLTDRAGNILAKRGENLPETLSGADFSPLPRGPLPESAWSNLGGQEYLVTAADFPYLNGTLVSGSPKEKVMGLLHDLTLGMISLAVFALLVAAALGWIMADRFIGQIQLLVEGIRKVSDGVLSWRVDNPGDDELGEACRDFNSMTERLERNRMVEDLWKQRWNSPK